MQKLNINKLTRTRNAGLETTVHTFFTQVEEQMQNKTLVKEEVLIHRLYSSKRHKEPNLTCV